MKTLAAKHQTIVAKGSKSLRRGHDCVHSYADKVKMKNLLVFSLRSWKPPKNASRCVDIEPHIYMLTMSRTGVIQRLNADLCEYCGINRGYLVVHHVRKLKDIKDGKDLWQKVMMAMQRKTLVLCQECHDLLHNGTLPSGRQRSRIEAESRTR